MRMRTPRTTKPSFLVNCCSGLNKITAIKQSWSKANQANAICHTETSSLDIRTNGLTARHIPIKSNKSVAVNTHTRSLPTHVKYTTGKPNGKPIYINIKTGDLKISDQVS